MLEARRNLKGLGVLEEKRLLADGYEVEAYFTTAFDLILSIYNISPGDAAVIDIRESLREFEMRFKA